ncbi:MAG TPA: APC family permease [Planctomycetota bacterium]|nr:APC family permease [Planctomycetota bacterium]
MTTAITKKRVRELLFGKAKNPHDPAVHQHLSLVAFLAWVGLGADGLSSACYGPEASFKALGPHSHLAPFLALATMVTVSVLSAAYSSTIAAFPSGGGGYTVASSTLGRVAGMICGCALVVDYVLTVAISVASGADAIFSMSFMPPGWAEWKHGTVILAIGLLMVMNFRGVKDSVIVLLPIFILFLVIHAGLILAALVHPGTPEPGPRSVGGAAGGVVPLGILLGSKLLLKAYSHGAGTYTGIEAISNSLSILREPRVQTARRAMLYMAVSLSLVAGGLLVGYLHTHVQPDGTKTFNAILAERIFGTGLWGKILVPMTLLSEATLLLCAAQAGFIDGPRVLASMAVDSWVPRRFSRLSDRLVVSNGILLIGVGGLIAIFVTRGDVDRLVVIYSFSVFVTFLLSQLGMVRYWFFQAAKKSLLRGAVSVVAALLSATILGSLFLASGASYAVYALAAIGLLGLLCAVVRSHYRHVAKQLQRLHGILEAAEADPTSRSTSDWRPDAPTAVFLVSGYNGPGMHTLMEVRGIFPDCFKQAVVVSVGQLDFDRFKGQDEVEHLKASVEADARKYVALLERWGVCAEHRTAYGVDLVDELDRIAMGVSKQFPRAVYFCGDLVFSIPSVLTRLLHARTGEELQRRFRENGLPLIVMPIRV